MQTKDIKIPEQNVPKVSGLETVVTKEAEEAAKKTKKDQGKLGDTESPLTEDMSKQKKPVENKKLEKTGDGSSHGKTENTRRLLDVVKKLTESRVSSDPEAAKGIGDKVLALVAKKKAMRKADPVQKPERVLNYAEMNKPKRPNTEVSTIDYSKLGPAPQRDPMWKRNAAVKQEQKTKAISVKHPDVITSQKAPSSPQVPQVAKPAQPALPAKPAMAIKKSEGSSAHEHLIGVVNHVEALLGKMGDKGLSPETEAKIAAAHQALSEAAHEGNQDLDKAATGFEKGVHLPSTAKPNSGTSMAGGKVSMANYDKTELNAPDRAARTMGYAKDDHRKKLNELKAMPKPNLGKSDNKKG